MSDHHHFNYIELPTTDMMAMKAFYKSVFGWDYIDYGPSYSAITGAGMDGGFDAEAGARKPSDQGALIVLYSDNLEATEHAVIAANAEITMPIFRFPGGRRFHFKDPSGNELAVWTKVTE
ncbi:VOC family protein [Hellea balneolensis]|uniref:VOC family protein n=1 Tax=Hellea balneolensis TaxID=287478 RepID=UPI000400B89F|nr:VOC family protein [Hellea balneolensis]